MIAAAHVLAGFVSGLVALPARTSGSRLAVAFSLGVASHVILDAIPHSDYGTLSRSTAVVVALIEVAATLAVGWYLLRSRRPAGWAVAIPAGLLGATIPDLKFATSLLPADTATWVQSAGDRFHGPFHATRSYTAFGLAAEIACTLLLLVGTVMLVRRYPYQSDKVQ